jgi:hypothetical protein
MTEIDKEVEELKKWFLYRIENFRTEYEKLDDLEKKFIIPSLHYISPCQIEVFWVKEPIECQLFIILHNPDRPDKEIIVNGPFKGFELEENVIKIMQEPRWNENAPYFEQNNWSIKDHEDVGNQEKKYSDYFTQHFSNFLNFIRILPLARIANGPVSGQPMGDDWCGYLKGNLATVNNSELRFIDSIISAKQAAERKRSGKYDEMIHSGGEAVKDSNQRLIGAYYYPGVRIGDHLELSFKEKLYSPNILNFPKCDFIFSINGRKIYCDTFGLVLIPETDQNKAIKFLNTMFAISMLFGFDSTSLRRNDLVCTKINPATFKEDEQFGGFSWTVPTTKRYIPTRFGGIRSIAISVEKMQQILNMVEKSYSEEIFQQSLLYLLESHTHFTNAEYSQSAFFSWLIIEQYINGIYDVMIKDKLVSKKRKTYLKNPSIWPTANKLEALNFANRIDDADYQFLRDFNEKRNKFVHKGETFNETDAKQLFDYSLDIVKKDFSRFDTIS